MRVPLKVDYGLRVLADLAQHYGRGPVQTAEIAARQNIPESYLEHLMATLNRSGFVRSRRGPQGGHMLALPPGEITLDRVMQSLEGSIAPLDCLEVPSECVLSSACAQRELWRTVEGAVYSVLRTITVADLVNRQRQMSPQPLEPQAAV